MKKLFLFTLLFVGCTQYRQLLITKATNCHTLDDGRFVYENDTVKITYLFWAENGIMDMRIYNKLSVPIYIDWKVSNFIDNTTNYQYWHDVANGTSVSYGVNYYTRTITGVPATLSNGSTTTTIERPDRIVSIAPHSSIKNSVLYYIIPKNDHFKDTGVYTVSNSPTVFRNYIALAMDEGFNKKFYIDNEFYISQVKQLKEKVFETQKDSDMYVYYISPYNKPTYFYTAKYKP